MLSIQTYFSYCKRILTFFYKEGVVFVVGDYNARVGNGSKKDYKVCGKNIDNIDDSYYEPDIPLPRNSQDNTCNALGVKLLDVCKST